MLRCERVLKLLVDGIIQISRAQNILNWCTILILTEELKHQELWWKVTERYFDNGLKRI